MDDPGGGRKRHGQGEGGLPPGERLVTGPAASSPGRRGRTLVGPCHNVAHSNDDDGLHVDGGPRPDGTTESAYYYPRENPADTGSSPVVASFENFAGYKNRG